MKSKNLCLKCCSYQYIRVQYRNNFNIFLVIKYITCLDLVFLFPHFQIYLVAERKEYRSFSVSSQNTDIIDI